MQEFFRKHNIFYGWVMVFAGMLVISAVIGIVTNCSSLFIVPVCEDLGFTRTAMNLTLTLQSLTGMAMALFSGLVVHRFGLKLLMRVSAVVYCGVYFCYSFANSITTFYIITMVSALTGCFLGTLPLAIIINNWFHKRQGLALGLVLMGSGIGGSIFNSLGGHLLETIGWRSTYLVFGAAVTLLILPMVFFVLKPEPEDMGLRPLGEDGPRDKVEPAHGIRFNALVRDKRFFVYIFCAVAIAISMISISHSMIPNMESLGYSTTFSANVCAAYMGLLAVSKIGLGWLFDRYGLIKASLVSLVSVFIALVGLAGSAALPFVYVAMAFGAPAVAFNTVAYPFITRSLFGQADYPVIMGVVQAAISLGCSIGPLISGQIYDRTGYYTFSYILCAASILVVGTLLLWAIHGLRKKNYAQLAQETAL